MRRTTRTGLQSRESACVEMGNVQPRDVTAAPLSLLSSWSSIPRVMGVPVHVYTTLRCRCCSREDWTGSAGTLRKIFEPLPRETGGMQRGRGAAVLKLCSAERRGRARA